MAANSQDANQCDGCRRGLPIRYSRVSSSKEPLHYDPDCGYVVMACTKRSYISTASPYDLNPNAAKEYPGE